MTDSDIVEIVENSWRSPVSVSDGSAPAQERDAKKAAVKQLRRYVREYTSDLRRVKKAELSFSFRMKESVLLGRIDLIRKDEGGIEVVDFKTSESSKERVEQEQVETQLEIYALGAELVCGKPVTKLTAHFLGSGEVDSRPWSPDKAVHARERLSGILGPVAAGSFQPRTAFCTRCTEFRSICMYTGR